MVVGAAACLETNIPENNRGGTGQSERGSNNSPFEGSGYKKIPEMEVQQLSISGLMSENTMHRMCILEPGFSGRTSRPWPYLREDPCTSLTRKIGARSPAVITRGLHIAQSRSCLCTLGPRVGIICVLGALG